MKVTKAVFQALQEAAKDGRATEGRKPTLPRRKLLGERRAALTLNLPWPPSVNECYRAVGGRVILSRTGREYPRVVYALCLEQGVGHVDGPLRLNIFLYPPDNGRKHDGDNGMKALFDAMQKAGVFEDDSQIEEHHVYRRQPVGAGVVVVQIEGVAR